eukprot:g6649.t1
MPATPKSSWSPGPAPSLLSRDLQVGDWVRISGIQLQTHQYLNGAVARVLEVAPAGQAEKVKVDCATVSRQTRHHGVHPLLFVQTLKRERLTVLDGFDPSGPLALGDFVEVFGLQSAAGRQLNSLRGQVVEAPADAPGPPAGDIISSANGSGGKNEPPAAISPRWGVCLPSLRAKAGELEQRPATGGAQTAIRPLPTWSPRLWLKSIKPENLRRIPKEACATIDIEQLAADIVAECQYVYRADHDDNNPALYTREKMMVKLLRSRDVSVSVPAESGATVAGHQRREHMWKLTLEQRDHRAEVFLRRSNEMGHMSWEVADVRELNSGDAATAARTTSTAPPSPPFTWQLFTVGKTRLTKNMLVGDQLQAMQFPADAEVRQLAPDIASIIRTQGQVLARFTDGVPADYDQDGSSYHANLAPTTFDVRAIKKVVCQEYDPKMSPGEPQKLYPYRELQVCGDDAKCITAADHADHKDPFLLCTSWELQESLGGYEKCLRLLTRVLNVDKCNEAAFVFCNMLEQLEPEILPTFRGNVVFDVRLELHGYIETGAYGPVPEPDLSCRVEQKNPHGRELRAPHCQVMSDFSSKKKTRATGMRADRYSKVASWSQIHSWLSFRTFDDFESGSAGEVGKHQRKGPDGQLYVLDLSAPQFGIFGRQIQVHEKIPDVFVLTAKSDGGTVSNQVIAEATVPIDIDDYSWTDPPTAKIKTRVRYCKPSMTLPSNFVGMAHLHWIYMHNNLHDLPSEKLSNICATFMERRYPRSIRNACRPYNYPAKIMRMSDGLAHQFFGIGSTDASDLTVSVYHLLQRLSGEVEEAVMAMARGRREGAVALTIEWMRNFLAVQSRTVKEMEELCGMKLEAMDELHFYQMTIGLDMYLGSEIREDTPSRILRVAE